MLGTSEGTKVYICTTPTSATAVSTLAALTFVEIKSAETLGDFGPQAQDVTFIPLAGPSVQHLKGATDNGGVTITCGKDPLDPGQIAMMTASKTKFEYCIKIVENDGADANDTDTVTYARGPIFGSRKSIGGANDVTKRTFMVGANVYEEVASVAVP